MKIKNKIIKITELAQIISTFSKFNHNQNLVDYDSMIEYYNIYLIMLANSSFSKFRQYP